MKRSGILNLSDGTLFEIDTVAVFVAGSGIVLVFVRNSKNSSS